MKLQFLGATGTVTGSKYLLEHEGRRVLIDCGLFQGLKQLRLRNWEGLPVDAASIDAVVLTHAHIDHSGFLPRLVKQGFRGRVHCSEATLDLCRLMLPDAGRLQEEEADYANRHGFSGHRPAEPLYTEEDAQRAVRLMVPQAFAEHFEATEDAFEPIPGLKIRLRPAGHLLGAASVYAEAAGRSVLFSGDLGRSDDILMKPPATPVHADYVVIESTYGDRLHPEGDPLLELAHLISRTAARGGTTLVPAFAVGRAQALLHCIRKLKHERRIPDLPVYLNSPMAADATQVYLRHLGSLRIEAEECRSMYSVAHVVNTIEQSKRLNHPRWPSLIVSASGMATGGRVLHHLKALAPDPHNTILFAGFQAAGTRGAAMVGGARSIKIHGEYIPVRADVTNFELLSAHADRRGLLDWISALPRAPRRVFVTHGEPVAADALRLAIKERHGWACEVPEYRQVVEL